MTTFNERAKFARKNAGLTQEELADRINKLTGEELTQAGVSRWERAGSQGTTYSAVLALVTNVNPVWLTSGKGAPEMQSLDYREAQQDNYHKIPKIPEDSIVDWLKGNYTPDPADVCWIELNTSDSAFAAKISEVKSSSPLLSDKVWLTFDPKAELSQHALITIRGHLSVRDVEIESGKTFFVGGRETLALEDESVDLIASLIGIAFISASDF